MTNRLLGTDPAAVEGGDALAVLARAAAVVAVPTAVVLATGMLLRGPGAAVTVLVTAAVLLGLHAGSAVVTARLSRNRPMAMPGITLVTLVLRLTVYGALVVLLADVAAVDVPAMATTVVLLTVVVLTVEATLVARYSRLWWGPPADPSTDGPGAAPSDATPTADPRSFERTQA